MEQLELKNLKIKALSTENIATMNRSHTIPVTVFASELCPSGLTHIPDNPGGLCSNEQ